MGVINWTSVSGIVIDLIALSILLSTTVLGYKNGLVGVVYKIVAFLASVIIVLFIYKPVAQMVIDNTNWDEKLATSIEKNLSGSAIDEEGNIVPEKNSNISDNVMNFISKLEREAVGSAKEKTITYVSENLAIFMVKGGTMIFLFVVVRLALIVIKAFVDVLASLPFIRTINKSGGIAYGVIKGFLIIYLILAVASLLSPLISRWGIIKAINDAYFVSRMYNNNIILNFVLGK